MKRVYLLLAIFSLFACNNINDDEEDLAWLSLRTALSELYEGNINSYIEMVDSIDLLLIGKKTYQDALKQKFNNAFINDSISFLLEDVDYCDPDTALIKYEVLICNKDTSYYIQKMVKNFNYWKIKII